MKSTRRFWLVSLIMVMGIVLSACGGNDEDKDTPIPPTATIPPTTVPTFQPAPTLPNPIDVRNQPSSEQAAVWVIQGVMGLPNVDIYLNDTLIVPRMAFNAITSRALPINAGNYQFSLVQAGQTPETEGVVLFEEDVAVEAGETTILVASGTPEAIQLHVVPQVLDPMEAGKARVVLVNSASGVATVDLIVNDITRVEALEAGRAGDEIILAEESYDFRVLTEGKLIVEATQQIRAGYAYTALLLNDTAPGTFKLVFLQGQTPPQTRVRLTHVAATVPEVAIYLDDERALTVGIGYLESLPFETIPSKTYRVRVVTTGDDPETLLSTNLSLTPNRTVDLVLLGDPPDLRLLQVDIDTRALAPDTTRLIIVNAIPGESQARAISASNREVRAQVPFGRASNPIELNLSENALYFMGGSQTEPHVIEDPRDFNFVAGEVYTYILSPSAVGSLLLLPTEVGTDSAQVAGGSGGSALPEDVSVQVVNALDSEGAISVSFDDVPRIEGVARGEVSSAVMLNSRVHPLQIQRGDELLYQGEVVIDSERSTFITLFVMGDDENVVISTEPDYDGSVSLSTILLRFVHAKSDGPDLSIYSPITEGTPMPENSTGRTDLINGLGINSVSSMVQIAAGTMQFGGLDARNGQLQFTSEPLTFEGGEAYDVLLLGEGEEWKIVVIRRER
ncbi:MAG: DUF4397 domain-containing protein [Anaerolineae bacterium]|nr:MAG: DUF4397 domain-containing protein [Anaerolineae bacterium]